jgi:hypothetical protein
MSGFNGKIYRFMGVKTVALLIKKQYNICGGDWISAKIGFIEAGNY